MKPKLRFKEFSDEWCETTLGETTTFKQGIQVDVDKQFSKPFDNSVRFIRIVDYTQNTKDIRYISKPANANYVDEHDVVLVRYGATAGFVGHGIKGVIANNMFTVTPNSNINKDFLYTILKQDKIYNKLNSSNGSSAMPALNFGSVSILKFSYPSIDEQNKLTNLINLLDKKIELQSKKIEDLKLFKMSTLDKYFNKDTCKEKALLKKYCSCLTGKSKADKVDINGNYYIMDMGTVNSDGNILKTKPTFCNLDLLSYGDLVMPKDDIGGGLIIGKTGFIDEDNKYVLGDHVYLLKVNDINSLFLHYQINSKYINKQLKRKVTGSAQLGLKSDNILNQEIYIYSEEEQKKIANIFKLIDRKIELEIEKIFKLINLKKGLMQNMFV